MRVHGCSSVRKTHFSNSPFSGARYAAGGQILRYRQGCPSGEPPGTPLRGICPASYNARMARPYDICIRGAGIVGRTLALHLAAKRLRVALIAEAGMNPAHSDVRAYALSPASRALLEAVRCWPGPEHATPVRAMKVQNQDGGFGDSMAQVLFDAAEQGSDALNWIVDVPVLEALLADAVRFQSLIEPNDTPQPASLTVVCEGRASRTREEFGVDFDITPYHQSALATRVECGLAHGQTARQWFAHGEILAFLPMGGAMGNLCAVVWSVSPERAHTLQHTTSEDFCHELHTASHGTLGTLRVEGERKTWPLQAARARCWSGIQAADGALPTAWVLAGDAAHNVHPLAGQGLNLGLGDVAELVKVLDDRPYWRNVADPKLLRAYERARKAEFALVGGSGDALQTIFSQTHPALQTVRHLGMNAFDHSGALKRWVAKRAMGIVSTAV